MKKYLLIFGLLVTGLLIGGRVFNVYFRQYSPAINFSGNEAMVVRVFKNNAKTLIIVGTKNTESTIILPRDDADAYRINRYAFDLLGMAILTKKDFEGGVSLNDGVKNDGSKFWREGHSKHFLIARAGEFELKD